MSNLSPVTHSVDAEGIAWIIFDDSSARANVLNPAMLSALRASLAAVAADLGKSPGAAKAVVIASAKERIFIAGADLKWIATLPDANAATLASREGQALFASIASFKIPVVCAIHGACAGGGYELALACTWRLAVDAPETRIGLPETGLGLIPGWGGCTRLPRLIGAQSAVEFILKAALVPAAGALAAGLVDEVVPLTEWKTRARAAALRLANGSAPARPVPISPSPTFFDEQRKIALSPRHSQSAALAVIDVVEKGASLPLAEALNVEAIAFGKIAATGTARNLIQIFLLKQKARKTTLDAWYPNSPGTISPAPFKTIGIVGAGVMGSGIAHWCAAHGYGVILSDASRAEIERGVAIIRELFADGVTRGKVTAEDAHRMTGGIGITTSLEDFEFCDFVIEAIAEDAAAKQKLFTELSVIVKPDCVLASNSSVVPIEELTATVAHPERVVGLHFFNPVSRMPLVELVLGRDTSRAIADRALALIRAMGKTAVVSRSLPGHFLSRVLSFYLNEACHLWEQGATTAVLDGAMSDWGWPMGPMRLVDEIGVDVLDAIFCELEQYFPGRFSGSTLCQRMLAEGLKGRKNGASVGFYNYVEEKEILNPDMERFAKGPAASSKAWEVTAVQDRLTAVLFDEARRALAEGVLKDSDDAVLALILGVGFPASRVGLLRGALS